MDCPGCGHPIEMHGIQAGCYYQDATKDCKCLHTQDTAQLAYYRIENMRLRKAALEVLEAHGSNLAVTSWMRQKASLDALRKLIE
jgi:hypothetical protein